MSSTWCDRGGRMARRMRLAAVWTEGRWRSTRYRKASGLRLAAKTLRSSESVGQGDSGEGSVMAIGSVSSRHAQGHVSEKHPSFFWPTNDGLGAYRPIHPTTRSFNRDAKL